MTLYTRLQADDQLMVAGPLSEVAKVDFGAPLHCLVIAGAMHEVEAAMMEEYGIDRLRQQGLIKESVAPEDSSAAEPALDDDTFL
jgi:hypothetical protein